MVRKLALALALVASTSVVLAGTPANAWSPPGTPGATGAGDPYYPLDGNGGYDVKHYDLALKYAPATDVLAGAVTIRATATQRLSAFNLDLDGLTIRSITVDGRSAKWSRAGTELTVTPRASLSKGHTFDTRIVYDGVPKVIHDPYLGDGGAFTTDDGVIILGEPDVAQAWYPSNDHPSDKASFSIALTVPKDLQAISNGVPDGRRTSKGWTTWRWEQREPMATYLAMAAIGKFDVKSYEKNGIRFVDAIDPALPPETYARVAKSFAREPEMLRFLSGYFGPYPFRASGGIVDADGEWDYALENQSRPIYTPQDFANQEDGDSVVVHELTHQWYGDSVAVQNWRDIWLNEGFATYAEWLWSEHEGLGTVQQNFDRLYATPATASLWKAKVADPGAPNLFISAVYNRGAMTLQALRLNVGDKKFFSILRTWAQSQRNGNGSTEEFTALAERISGKDLSALFTTWLYTPSKPANPA
ncbi:M1 family metallopeptidase [Actinoplanes sp. TBRC 11911]|uniref:M1 family metallopeptidase n=1 Tax=Actinoplanes sp. TBRC 11911 TaxID=2729386 RepID=UPI00145E3020|nr:M1 family metallopeptidase [Actinoplanes sp. TBRC 11911]NMO49943.1 M1 family metallopeptidase [Actinoplanes sp. TBRC 11911]